MYSIAKDFLLRSDMTLYKNRSSTPEGLNKLLDEVPLSTIVEANAMSASFVRNMVKNKRKDHVVSPARRLPPVAPRLPPPTPHH